MRVAKIDARQRVIRDPFAALSCRAISPIARPDQVIGIKRLQIIAHLFQPCAPFFPTASQALRLVHQLIAEDGRIVAIQEPRDAVAARGDLLDVPAVKPSRHLVRIELHRLFVVDAERKLVVIRAIDSGPAQVLGYAASVAPPIAEAKLHLQSVMRGFGDNAIEKNKLGFVPLVRRTTKPTITLPVIRRLHVGQTAFPRSPNPHNAHS